MTTPKQVDERMAAWFQEEAPGQLPDRVLQSTFDRTRSTRQAGGPFSRRSISMTRLVPGLIAIGATAIMVAVGATLLLRPDSPPRMGVLAGRTGPTPAAADLVLNLERSATASHPPLPSPRVFETASWSGPIQVTTGDLVIDGQLRLQASHELEYGGSSPPVSHTWGSLTGRLGGATCEGSLAFTFYLDGDVGGTMSLHCDDGSMLGGSLPSVTITMREKRTASWDLAAHLDGVYHPGS